MSKAKSTPKKRKLELAAARSAGGNEGQSHWMDRLRVVVKRRARTVNDHKSKK
jgi:hypothetical protein